MGSELNALSSNPEKRGERPVLNVLHDTMVIRRVQLGLYGCCAIAALIMGIVSVTDARFPWFIVALFSGGSLFDALREKSERRT